LARSESRRRGRLIELDPLDEHAHRQLMTAYARTGRTSRALRQFLDCRKALVEELGIEPSAATSRLQARILAGKRVERLSRSPGAARAA
jgi:DNA-binding SARP family transcriptional activator